MTVNSIYFYQSRISVLCIHGSNAICCSFQSLHWAIYIMLKELLWCWEILIFNRVWFVAFGWKVNMKIFIRLRAAKLISNINIWLSTADQNVLSIYMQKIILNMNWFVPCKNFRKYKSPSEFQFLLFYFIFYNLSLKISWSLLCDIREGKEGGRI